MFFCNLDVELEILELHCQVLLLKFGSAYDFLKNDQVTTKLKKIWMDKKCKFEEIVRIFKFKNF